MDRAAFNILLQAYADNSMTQQQWEEFRTAVQSGAFDQELEADFAGQLKKEIIHPSWNETRQQKTWTGIGERIGAANNMDAAPAVHRVPSLTRGRHFLKTAWFQSPPSRVALRWAKYAAAIILITGVGAYLWNTQTRNKEKNHPLTHTQPVPKEILPGGNKALLTLADGSTIVLDSAANGQLAVQGSSQIIKKDGQLLYSAGGTLSPAGVGGSREARDGGGLNTMTTPRGGQYQLTLHDGTRVWLNAASSITYPTAFTGKTREVSITGEAYFEVTKNPSKPFIVKTQKEDITVLGTEFNVNAYPDEPVTKTSLVEGLVKINHRILKPGQAYVNGKVITANVEQDVAWKNGVFNFNDKPLSEVMRQLERWYDVTVTYEKNIPNIKIGGEMGRDLSLTQVLDGLNDLNIHYRLEGRKLIIQP